MNNGARIGIGCDHTGVDLKNSLMAHLKGQGYMVVDYGAYDPETKTDYPLKGQEVAEALIKGDVEKAVLICGTGIGISLAANKVPGIRAAVCSEPYSAAMSVKHNDANIIAMGARVVGEELAKMIVDSFLNAEFEGKENERHARRVGLIGEIERKYGKSSEPKS